MKLTGTVQKQSISKKEKEIERFFTVFYCKASKKKHKTHEDGVLVAGEKLCHLKSIEDKFVAKRLFGSTSDLLFLLFFAL